MTLDNPFIEMAAEHQPWLDGERYLFTFGNGYHASVIRHPGTKLGSASSYGYDDGLWELAVLDQAHEPIYTTITPAPVGVAGWLDVGKVRELLRAIGELPPRSQR